MKNLNEYEGWESELLKELYCSVGQEWFVARDWQPGFFADRDGFLLKLLDDGILQRSSLDEYNDRHYRFHPRISSQEYKELFS